MIIKPGIERNNLWIKLIGSPLECSMENRAFNYVSVITFLLLLIFLPLDIYIGQTLMSLVIVILMTIQAILYYFSRFKKRYACYIIMYAACSYIGLIINYYTNSGISGPTIYIFFLTFHLLISISKTRLYPLWIILHISIVSALLISEYIHPDWVLNNYPKRSDEFLDLEFSYLVALIFIFCMTTYLRKYFNYERKLAEERALAISDKNDQIIEQNKLLEKVNEEKNKLFSIISHDLRSPIDSIRGYLELLSENLLSEEEKISIQDELLTQTKYTSELLLNILYWSKTQMQGVTVQLKPLSLKTIIEAAANLKVTLAAKKEVKLTYSIPGDIEVIADEDMLIIVLRNLVNNAIKFTPPGGEIFIHVTTNKNDGIQIAIQDTGIGIPEEKQDSIFTFKTQSTFGTNNEKGIGMGLMLCKEFMDYQHGKIWFESKQGDGTTFYVTLPKPQL